MQLIILKVMLSVCCLCTVISPKAGTIISIPVQKGQDHYLWMESDPQRTHRWLQFKTQQTRKIIDNLPSRIELEPQHTAKGYSENDSIIESYYVNDVHFYLKVTAEFPYRRLFMTSHNKEKLLVEPPVGKGIQFFVPSNDGQYIAYGIAENGSEFTSIFIFDVKLSKNLEQTIPNARYPKIIWRSDNRSFYYKHLAPDKPSTSDTNSLAGERVYLHHIVKNYKDDDVIFDVAMVGLKNNQSEDVTLYTSKNSDWLLASVTPSISGFSSTLFAVHAKNIEEKNIPWKKIIGREKKVASFILTGNWLWLASYNDKSGYFISRFDISSPLADAEKILEWSYGELTGFTASKDATYVSWIENGAQHLISIPHNNVSLFREVFLPKKGTISGLYADVTTTGVSLSLENWLSPMEYIFYNSDKGSFEEEKNLNETFFPVSEYQIEDVSFLTKDNVSIPLTIISRRNLKLNGTAPTWLIGYGAYGISLFPRYETSYLKWLKSGGIIAIAHIRGGGELGPEWHKAGRGANKMHSINDFIESAEYLIKQKYTNPHKLVASGESAGGIVVGMAMVSRPDLFSAIAIDVGILNTTRLHKIPIGPMNIKEFGSPATRQGMKNLRKIDAYENLRPGVRYPAVLLTLGLKDNRVSPWQTAKFAAKLEEFSSHVEHANPILILAEDEAGHAPGTYDQANKKNADMIKFFLWRTHSGDARKRE